MPASRDTFAMPGFVAGSRYDVTIKNAELVSLVHAGSDVASVLLAFDHQGQRWEVQLPADQQLFTPSEPPGWPPQPGDVWNSIDHVWFFYSDTVMAKGPGRLNARNEAGEFIDGRGPGQTPAQRLRAKYGWALVLTFRLYP